VPRLREKVWTLPLLKVMMVSVFGSIKRKAINVSVTTFPTSGRGLKVSKFLIVIYVNYLKTPGKL
jgi:hypothetical protein